MSKAGNFCLVKLVLQDCWNSLAYFDIDEEKWPVQFFEQFSIAPKWRIPFSVIIILKPKIPQLLYFYTMKSTLLKLFCFPSILFSINCFHTQHILHKVQYLFLEKVKLREDVQRLIILRPRIQFSSRQPYSLTTVYTGRQKHYY